MLKTFYRAISVLFISIIFISGCGYTNQAILPNGIQTIAVPTIKNKLPQNESYTYEAGIEITVTNGIIDRLIFDGNLRVVSVEEADSVLYGTLTSYNQESIRYEGRSDVKEYRLFIGIDLEFVDNRTQETFWTETGFTGRTEFFRTGSSAKTERAALLSAKDDLAKKIVDRIVEDW